MWGLDSGNPAGTFRENEFDYRQKPQQNALLPLSANESTNAAKIFRKMFIE